MRFKIKYGQVGVRLADIVDDLGSIREDWVEWFEHGDRGRRTEINGCVLEVRKVRGEMAYDGYISGKFAGFRSDTVQEVMTSLLARAAPR